jgi:hypothetical protein
MEGQEVNLRPILLKQFAVNQNLLRKTQDNAVVCKLINHNCDTIDLIAGGFDKEKVTPHPVLCEPYLEQLVFHTIRGDFFDVLFTLNNMRSDRVQSESPSDGRILR